MDFLRTFHYEAPFSLFNGNTFAAIGKELCLALFSDLPGARKKELSSVVSHYIAGVLDRESMISSVNTLAHSADFAVGSRVMTLRTFPAGVIIRLLEDGHVVWRPDGTDEELTVLPESLLPEIVT